MSVKKVDLNAINDARALAARTIAARTLAKAELALEMAAIAYTLAKVEAMGLTANQRKLNLRHATETLKADARIYYLALEILKRDRKERARKLRDNDE